MGSVYLIVILGKKPHGSLETLNDFGKPTGFSLLFTVQQLEQPSILEAKFLFDVPSNITLCL